jgi:hypothetical protein
MNLRNQFNTLTEFFEREQIDYAVIGAFALHAYGYTRATQDIDFITRMEYQEKIVGYLESLGFETLNRSPGYSNHLSPVKAIRVDLVYVEGKTAEMIFKGVPKKTLFQQTKIPVVRPEHLIALKLFSVKNDPERKLKELADIKEIIQLTPVNREEIKTYFQDYGLEEYYHEIIES